MAASDTDRIHQHRTGRTSDKPRRARRTTPLAKLTTTATFDPATHRLPDISAEIATQVALLLTAGLTPDRAVAYVLPGLDDTVRATITTTWMGSRYMLDALATLNGGQWQDLPPDQRIHVALSKHRAECAYLMYTQSLAHADRATFTKLSYAREVLDLYTKGDIDSNDPLAAFGRMAEDIMRQAVAPTPPHAAASDAVPPVDESSQIGDRITVLAREPKDPQ
jgi:hypothetical protein